MKDKQALDRIRDILDRQVWDADTLDAIADVVRQTGRKIRDVGN
jgi:hypothetical protein